MILYVVYKKRKHQKAQQHEIISFFCSGYISFRGSTEKRRRASIGVAIDGIGYYKNLARCRDEAFGLVFFFSEEGGDSLVVVARLGDVVGLVLSCVFVGMDAYRCTEVLLYCWGW